jgi:hypothetical protein
MMRLTDEETMRWVLWLTEDQRHLVWLRAEERGWRTICRRLGCDRTTAWRRWQKALETVVERLNASSGTFGQSMPLSGIIRR